ncbi:MAG: DHHA1 domain-containing protein [Bacilli bacterium]
MKKICLITHAADMDGAFPIILAKKVFENVDDFSCEIDEVDDTLKQVITHYEDYETIYIVDLSVSDEMAQYINKDEILRNKIQIYDHHQSREHQNIYPFINIISSQNGRKESGTSLFYNCLKNTVDNSILMNNAVIELVELIRENDTYDFLEENKEKANQLAELYDIYGRDRFINNYSEFIEKNNYFYFTDTEIILHEIESERTKRYIEEKLKHVIKAKIDGIPVGIVFAEKKRSLLGHTMTEIISDIDIAIIINVDKSVSYRADKDEVDVNVIAKPYGGGGHKHAGGSPLPEDLQEKISEYIFKNIEWIK